MVSPEQSPLQTASAATAMAKTSVRNKPSSFLLTDGFLFVGGAMSALLVVWALWSFVSPNSITTPSFSSLIMKPETETSTASEVFTAGGYADDAPGAHLRQDPPARTFYDDPTLSYSIGKPIRNWDEKRRGWLRHHHPSFAAGVRDRIFLVSGSQPWPCANPIGDHLLMRFFKNKVDYCRIHGYDIFYNNALFHPKMTNAWAKLPLVRAAMVAHPEAEWIWWVDSDAAFTDMEFKLPLRKYIDHNLIVHGWPREIYERHSWVGLNAGVFLIRNCQWSMDFIEAWAAMGPQTPDYDKWGKILTSTLADRTYPESDDQGALLYLILKEKEKWGDKIFIETEFYFEGYWLEIVGKLENVTDKYMEVERRVRGLRRRHAEKVSERYGAMREPYLKKAGQMMGGWRRPFITHFAGCQPCSGKHNQTFSGTGCWSGMQKALNFADNQVLRSFGFMHGDLQDPSSLSPLPFDFPE